MLSKLTLTTIGLGLAGIVGYCIYFDKKRRMDPLYKRNVSERRRLQKQQQQQQQSSVGRAARAPYLMRAEDVKRYFLQQIHLSETLIQQGHHERGAEHLANALRICSDGPQMLQSIRANLQPSVYQMVMERMQQQVQMPGMNGIEMFVMGEAGGNPDIDNLD